MKKSLIIGVTIFSFSVTPCFAELRCGKLDTYEDGYVIVDESNKKIILSTKFNPNALKQLENFEVGQNICAEGTVLSDHGDEYFVQNRAITISKGFEPVPDEAKYSKQCGKLQIIDWGNGVLGYQVFRVIDGSPESDSLGNSDSAYIKNLISSNKIEVGDNICVEGAFMIYPDGLELVEGTVKNISIESKYDESEDIVAKVIGPNIKGFQLGQTLREFTSVLENIQCTIERDKTLSGSTCISAYVKGLHPNLRDLGANIMGFFENGLLKKFILDNHAIKYLFNTSNGGIEFLQAFINAYDIPGLHVVSQEKRPYGAIVSGVRIWRDKDDSDGWTVICKETGQAYNSGNISNWKVTEIKLESHNTDFSF